jgi:hypothetical protein
MLLYIDDCKSSIVSLDKIKGNFISYFTLFSELRLFLKIFIGICLYCKKIQAVYVKNECKSIRHGR